MNTICRSRRSIAGVDGCRGGWVVAKAPLLDDEGPGVSRPRRGEVELKVCPTWLDVVKWCRGAVRIAVDMPIGLPDRAEPGGRPCDRAARKLLRAPDGGPGRSNSVFSAPVRGVLKAKTYEEALAISRASSEHNIGLSKQTWNIVPKIREIDEWMTPARARRVFECHPEIVFAVLNAGRKGALRPMSARKGSQEGAVDRMKLLDKRLRKYSKHRQDIESIISDVSLRGSSRDDRLDACATLLAISFSETETAGVPLVGGEVDHDLRGSEASRATQVSKIRNRVAARSREQTCWT